MPIVGREAGQEHRRGNVTDDLAGRRTHQKRRERDERAERVADGGYAREIARKDKEGAKSEQQSVIHEQKAFRFGDQQRRGDDDKPYPIGENAEDYHYREDKEREIEDHAPKWRRGLRRRLQLDRFGLHEKAGHGDEHERHGEGDRHYLEKFARIYRIVRIKIEVLRIAERGEHAAKVRRHVLHNEDERRIFRLTAGREHEPAQGQKSHERHVVRHDHGAEIGDEDERESHTAHILERRDYLDRQPLEKPPPFQRGDHGERAEQARERL